jgi:pimeloyl-ACP methyl ester carboxylesterase
MVSRLGFLLSASLCFIAVFATSANAQLFPKNRRDTGPKPKNIHGVVQDARGKPLIGARVFVKDMKSNVTRSLDTDQRGEYRVAGLTPTVDYEVYAEFKGTASEKKIISSFLNREDNVLNFQLDVAVLESTAANGPSQPGLVIKSFDLVELHASFEMPVGVQAPIPSVLLLHGYGENRSAWRDLSKELVNRGWAVLSLDLRGHGESKTKNQRPIEASPSWRTDSREFPVDLDPALDWMKSQPRLDDRKIAVIGFDVGANLALIASGRFAEVRTVAAIKPNLNESLALAGSAQDFQPRSALIIAPAASEPDRIRRMVQTPARLVLAEQSGGAAEWASNRAVKDAIFQWLKETY